MGRNKINTETFIERAIKIHGSRYNYTDVVYHKLDSKVSISCVVHGLFLQNAADHLNGNGCPECGGNKKMDRLSFAVKANKIHNDKYDYSLVNYINNKTKVTIVCPEHGEFQQQPNNHISGQGCPKCKRGKLSSNMVKGKEEVISRLNNIFGNTQYTYDLSKYTNNRSYITIICHIHGPFSKSYQSLIKGNGCSDCAGYKSKGEKFVGEWLDKNGIEYIPQMKFKGCMLNRELKFDYYIPKYNTCIEYNGKQHYYASSKFGGENEFELTQKRDQIKINYCLENSIPLLIIKWDENPVDKLQSVFLDIA
jgi:hypothetical protein